MKTQNQKTIELLERNDKKSVYYNLKSWTFNRDRKDNLIGDTFIELISENSENQTLKNLCLQLIDKDTCPSRDEAIDLTNEIFDNKSRYIKAMDKYADKAKLLAFEVIKEMHPEYSDAEIWSKIG